MANKPTRPSPEEQPPAEPEAIKMTVYLSPKLVDLLDELKVEDQKSGLVSRHMSRPRYVQRALQHYAELRRPPGTGEPYPRK